MSGTKKPSERSVEIKLASGKTTIIKIRRSSRVHRLALRILPSTGQAELVLPRHVSEQEGVTFLHQKIKWLDQRLIKYLKPVPFKDGETVPFLGEPLIIFHLNSIRRDIYREKGRLIVTGPKVRLSKAIHDWYRREGGAEITSRVKEKSEMLGKKYGRLTIRDTKSRWGSCSSKGNLNFSWRVVMAPPYVLDYLVAHEVAHLAEMNHSARFWDIVESLTDELQRGRRWLRHNGHELHRYGVEPPTVKGRESE